jgi:hypothetical protein
VSYYMGDYYPRGDPGIFDWALGAAKKVAGFVGRFTGGGGAKTMPGGSAAAGAITAAAKGAIQRVGGAVMRHPVLSAAGAAGAAGAMAGAGAEMIHMGGAGAACPRGYHPCKSKHGCKKGPCVRNRRMNSCNPRALRRAARRLHSFARHYRKAVGFTSPHPKRGRMYFKSRRKKH